MGYERDNTAMNLGIPLGPRPVTLAEDCACVLTSRVDTDTGGLLKERLTAVVRHISAPGGKMKVTGY